MVAVVVVPADISVSFLTSSECYSTIASKCSKMKSALPRILGAHLAVALLFLGTYKEKGHRRPAEALISRWSVSVSIENDARFTVCHICFSATAEANFVPGPLPFSVARNIGSVFAAAQLTFWGVAEGVGGNNRETWLFALFLRILAQRE